MNRNVRSDRLIKLPDIKRRYYWLAQGMEHIVELGELNHFCNAINNHGLSYLKITGHRTLSVTN